jgi:hypothetical protein
VSFDFAIGQEGKISALFLQRDISCFSQACAYIKGLPYKRNSNKEDLSSLFTDGYGTCSTKHAVLKVLATENGVKDVRLMLGIYKMSAQNTPEVSETLTRHSIDYIPEAHMYLKVQNKTVDCTKQNSNAGAFESALLEELEIEPSQITGFKVSYHRQFLASWLVRHTDITYDLPQLWSIREQCIEDLSR